MRDRADRAFELTVWALALGPALLLVHLLASVVLRGGPLLGAGFLLGSVEDSGRAGGILPVLISTAWVLAVAAAAAIPLGLGAALLLTEAPPPGPWAARLRRCLGVLAGVPSVVFGLFGAVFFGEVMGLGLSLVCGGLTLACMVLPLFARGAEESLRAVPSAQRQAAAALGLSTSRRIWRVSLPAAAPGILAAGALSLGRALAETAALLFTSGYVARMPSAPWDSGRALSVHIYDLAMNVPGGDRHAHAAALVLVLAVLAVDAAAAALVHGRERRRGLL